MSQRKAAFTLKQHHCRSSPAFTLVELSIVLVILGLLIGGVLTGQSLIKAAQLRAASTEFTRYKAAAYTFRDKYQAVPGDMTNASRYWGAFATCPGDYTTPHTGTATCDGNGSGTLDTPSEQFNFWQQLANGGLIEGSYTGVTADSSSSTASIGKNVPASKMSGSGWSAVYWVATTPTNPDLFEGSYENALVVGAVSTNYTERPMMKAEDAYNIDMKIDDGKPGTGFMRSYKRHTTCHDAGVQTTATAAIAKYNLSTTNSDACAPIITLF